MILFLAINTAGISAIPVNVVAARAAIDPSTAGDIVLPTIIVSCLTMITAVLWVHLLQRLPGFVRTRPDGVGESVTDAVAVEPAPPQPALRVRLGVAAVAASCAAAVSFAFGQEVTAQGWGTGIRSVSGWLFAIFGAGMILYGAYRGVKVYEAAIDGAKEGFEVAIRIMPYLVIILVAVGMLRASSLMDALVSAVAPVTNVLGMPGAVLPQALVRPLSGSAAMGVLVDILQREGPSSPAGFVASVIYGSSETTFYVLSVYFGAVGVRSLGRAGWSPTIRQSPQLDMTGIAALMRTTCSWSCGCVDSTGTACPCDSTPDCVVPPDLSTCTAQTTCTDPNDLIYLRSALRAGQRRAALGSDHPD
jgi:spore maturation protein SpmB